MTINPHDAEEALRPYLGRLHDAREAHRQNPMDWFQSGVYTATLELAVDKAIELLGVQR